MGKNNPLKLDSVSFSQKGQIVIPQWIRKEYEIEEGTKVLVFPTPEGILLKPITAKHIRKLRGSLKGSRAMEVFQTERKKEKEL